MGAAAVVRNMHLHSLRAEGKESSVLSRSTPQLEMKEVLPSAPSIARVPPPAAEAISNRLHNRTLSGDNATLLEERRSDSVLFLAACDIPTLNDATGTGIIIASLKMHASIGNHRLFSDADISKLHGADFFP
jgi:hypothetical protein